jgi:N-acetylglutamate synthase-like GNAT family acetyltransferase
MNIIEVEFSTPEYDETIRLRYKILREPLGFDFTEEQLAAEYSDFHLAAYDDAWILRGCLVLTPKDGKVLKMRQVAVDNTVQNRGIGSQLVKASEVYARAKDFDTMELNARDTAVPFYLKLGYNTEGAMFEEVSISHFKMVKKLWQSHK